MRIRITQSLGGNIDGMQLSRLECGKIYDVNTSLATYLLCERMAETVTDGSEGRRTFDIPPSFAAARALGSDPDPSLN